MYHPHVRHVNCVQDKPPQRKMLAAAQNSTNGTRKVLPRSSKVSFARIVNRHGGPSPDFQGHRVKESLQPTCLVNSEQFQRGHGDVCRNLGWNSSRFLTVTSPSSFSRNMPGIRRLAQQLGVKVRSLERICWKNLDLRDNPQNNFVGPSPRHSNGLLH